MTRRPGGLRAALGRFATGVAVVTLNTENDRHGLTINSFTSVSLDPPLVLISIARSARAHDLLTGRPFCVNVLGAEQQAIAQTFAGGPRAGSDRDRSRTPTIVWIDGEHAPRLAGVLAHLECLPWRAYDGGDHTLYIGEVVDYDFRDGDALAYMTSGFRSIDEQSFGHEYLL